MTSSAIISILPPHREHKQRQSKFYCNPIEVSTDNSNILSLPYIAPSQAQKHVTHNASAEWQNHENEIASFVDNAWEFANPKNGWLCWDETQKVILVYSNAAWEIYGLLPEEIGNISAIGINAQASLSNRLTVSADTTLLTHQGADHRLVVNKQAQTNTARLIFQNNFSARAEIGLSGNDDFKIRDDGSNFEDALSINKDTGIVIFGKGVDGIINEQDFGSGEIINTDYMTAKGRDLFTNGTAQLANTYNLPNMFNINQGISPNLPASFCFEGYYTGLHLTQDFLPIDPNKIYKFQSYLYEEDYNHLQYMTLEMYDADKLSITSQYTMRFAEGGVDSYTTPTAPLNTWRHHSLSDRCSMME